MPLADKRPDRTDPDQLCHFLLFRLCRALACPPAPRLLGSLWANRRGAQFFHCCSHDVRLCSPLTLLFTSFCVLPTLKPSFCSAVAVAQSLSCVWLFVTPWTAARQASLSFTISQSLLKLMSMESVMPSNHLILCRPLLLQPSTFPSNRVFPSELALHIRWPKYWSFSFSQRLRSLDPTVLYVFGSHCTLCLIFSSEQNFTLRTFLLFSFLWRPSRAKLIFLAYSQWPTNPSITPQRFHPLQMLSVFKRATYFFFQSKYFKRFLK